MSHTPGPWYVSYKPDADEAGLTGEDVYYKDETRAVAEVLSRCLGEPLGDPEEVLTEEEQQKKQELVQNFMNCIRAPRDAVSNPMNRVVLDFLQTLLNRT